MKKIIIIAICIIIVVAIALLAPPITSKAPDQLKGVPSQSPVSNVPTPRPTPMLNIDKNSNLPAESRKLSVPDYKNDYDALDKTLSGF